VAARTAPAASARDPLGRRLGAFATAALVLLPPFVLSVAAKEAFRMPKLLASGWLALLAAFFLSWLLREVDRVRLSDLWRATALRGILPLLLVATVSLWTTAHPLHARSAVADLWIAAAALVAWSLALGTRRLEGLLRLLLLPAAALGLIGILQFFGVAVLPFESLAAGSRLAITSLAGNPGDLGAYLVLPVLIAQWVLARRPAGWRRIAAGLALAVSLTALALTQTLAAFAAVVAGSLVFWLLRLPRRRTVPALAVAAGLAVVLVVAVPPLRQRAVEKVGQALRGDLNAALTGRLDGWNTAVWMLREHPLAGVGQGAYRPEFIPAKIALLDRGVPFFPGQNQVVFANAHNEILEVGADLGIPGLLALGWALWTLGTALVRGRDGQSLDGDRALAWGGVIALLVLALAQFPFRIALVAFPALLFLAWVCRRPVAEPAEEGGGGIPGRILVWPVALVLLLALLGQTGRWRDRLTASRTLRQVEVLTMMAASSGQAPRGLLPANLEALRQAAALDPLEVGIPIARGSIFYLLGSPQSALDAYRQAEALEPRPEIDLNIGRALLLAGRPDEARVYFRRTVRLAPHLAPVVPSGML
jgi:O-antigen ligase